MPHAEGRVVAEAAEVAFSAPAYSRIRLVERLRRRLEGILPCGPEAVGPKAGHGGVSVIVPSGEPVVGGGIDGALAVEDV